MQELSINGKHYSGKELLEHCNNRIGECSYQWERDVYQFILEWLNDKDFVIAKTSGSTGTPKEIVLYKNKMLASAKTTGEFFNFQKGQKALLCLSTNYIAGKMMVVRAFLWQLDLLLVQPDGHPLRNLQEDVDFAAMLPVQLANCFKENLDINKIKSLLLGGGGVDSSLVDCLQNLKTKCFLGYGMTETVSHVAIKALNGKNKSGKFKGIGNVSFSIDKRDCLLINAPDILVEPVVTNDIVKLYPTGEFEWRGRYDNVVNSGGIKLFPEQIEEKLKPFMHEPFFLAGVADEKLGEKLVLLVEKPGGDSKYKIELFEKMKGLLDKYEQAREIIFLSEFRRTLNGKLQRSATLSSNIDR